MTGSDSDKAFASQREQSSQEHTVHDGAGVKPYTKRQKGTRHCKKWWWVYLLILCALVLIITLPIIYVAFPHIAQKGVDDTSGEVTELQFLNPTNHSVEITQKVTVHSPSKYTPTLDSFTAGSYLVTNGKFGAKPMIYVQIPQTHALHPLSYTSVVNQTVEINDLDQITEYTTQTLSNENVTTALTGKTKLHLGKLPVITVNYNQSSTYKGLNGLKGFNVTNIRIDPTNTLLILPNLNGSAYIPNPSLLTIELGNVTLNLSHPTAGHLGQAQINNLIIRPGNNTVPLTGVLNQTLVLQNLDNGFLNMTITGDSAVRNGQHLTYYEKALASNVLSLRLNVLQIVRESLGG